MLGRFCKLTRLVGRYLVEADSTGVAFVDFDEAKTVRSRSTRSLYFVHTPCIGFDYGKGLSIFV